MIRWPVYEKQNFRQWISAEAIDDAGIDLLERMLVYEPSQRITARQALAHPYFTGVQLPDFNF
jgi:serine/threonine protein kinase|tara:strand:+ start:262 stop:450 length:189 start_codon:yes stop_codon:yes gene_type:complete